MRDPDETSGGDARPKNHLAGETSPYLLQHVHNPVDWHPWGPEALEKAKREDKPIFLSIGYSACHWCHVMERESFEDDGIAAFLNEHFVPIKVDREERPDLDDIYMSAVQLMTGQGGWPLSAWLTPDLKPFFGGTYFPPDDRYGRPGFRGVLSQVAEVWRTRRGDVDSGAEQVADRIASFGRTGGGAGLLTTGLLLNAARSMLRGYDPRYGGFGDAPKFPHSMGIQLLLRAYQRTGDAGPLEAATVTLDRMAQGGIYDHLGGGFHRYSTDARWLVPHFEKMLYDQALLAVAYIEAWQVTRSALYKKVVEETLDWVLRDMTSPEGAFHATLDADTEGEEGKFYVWSPEEVVAVLGEDDGRLFCRAYDVDEGGNFEGRSILHPMATAESLAQATGKTPEAVTRILADASARLLEARATRVAPSRDDKILASWNGLMISAFARAGRAFGEPKYLRAARRSADFVLSRMQRDGRLLRVHMDGRARFPAYLDDYANLIAALVDLYEAGFEERWLDEAQRLAAILIADFGDPGENGAGGNAGFFYTTAAHDDVLVRIKNAQDGSTPSGNSMAAYALLRLGRLVGDAELESLGESTVRAFQPLFEQAPGAFHQMLLALDLLLGPRQEIVIAGPPKEAATVALMERVNRSFLPRAVTARTDGRDGDPGGGARTGSVNPAPAGPARPLLEGKTLVDGRPAVYVCRDFSCEAPVTTEEALAEALERAEKPEPRE